MTTYDSSQAFSRARTHGRGDTAAKSAGVMLLNLDRSAYAGLLGKPSRRIYGSLTVYASLGAPFRLCIENGTWDHAELAVVPPFVPHHIATDDRVIGVVLLEPESFDPRALPPFLAARGAVAHPELLDRIRDAFGRLRRGDPTIDPRTVDIDTLFFGQAIPRREADPRVALVAQRIRQRPCTPLGADTCASLTGLSCSRFLHLFKAELGTTFRGFRAWKRARSMLEYVSRDLNLSDFALELGYPDASHFSHSIRNFYGLTPRDIFSGSRRLAVVSQNGSAQASMSVA